MNTNLATVSEAREKLEIVLRTGTDIVWLNKRPPAPYPPQCMELMLSVTWPYRSVWRGECPTAQLCDFWIEFREKTVWRWSEEQMFAAVITPVIIPGGSSHEFTAMWSIDPDVIESEGTGTAKALFIASGQEATAKFEVRFVQ